MKRERRSGSALPVNCQMMVVLWLDVMTVMIGIIGKYLSYKCKMCGGEGVPSL